jgi:hypothetical protein
MLRASVLMMSVTPCYLRQSHVALREQQIPFRSRPVEAERVGEGKQEHRGQAKKHETFLILAQIWRLRHVRPQVDTALLGRSLGVYLESVSVQGVQTMRGAHWKRR